MNYGISLSALLNWSCKLQSCASKSVVQSLTCEWGKGLHLEFIRYTTELPVAVHLSLQQHGNMWGMLAVWQQRSFSLRPVLERPVELFHSKQRRKNQTELTHLKLQFKLQWQTFSLKKAATVLEDLEKICFNSTLWRNAISVSAPA